MYQQPVIEVLEPVLVSNLLVLQNQLVYRSGKSTHISMISNSVTHLRSYTNTAIVDIAGNSARAPISKRQVRRAKSQRLHIERQYLGIERRYRRIE